MRRRTTELDQILKSSYWREDQARAVLDRWAISGLTLRAFAHEHGTSHARLTRWRRRLQEGLTFHPVQVVTAPESTGSRGRLELVLRGDRRLLIEEGFDPLLLRRLVETVESWSC